MQFRRVGSVSLRDAARTRLVLADDVVALLAGDDASRRPDSRDLGWTANWCDSERSSSYSARVMRDPADAVGVAALADEVELAPPVSLNASAIPLDALVDLAKDGFVEADAFLAGAHPRHSADSALDVLFDIT